MASLPTDALVLRGSGSSIPLFLYGTAWKKDRTTELVYQALCAGFNAVDTAAQPKHYREDLVGQGIRRAISEGKVSRSKLYIQTKYTSVAGQDPEAMPYDPNSSISEQVHTSIKSSLANFQTPEGDAYLDALVMHSPLQTMEETLEAWLTFETYVPDKIRHLGISNCTLPVLKALFQEARIKPAVVQNCFYPATHYDTGLRQFCRDNSIVYQSFWTLTANPELVWSKEVGELAQQAGVSQQAALYCMVLALGNTVILNGTKNSGRMSEDLAAPNLVAKFASKNPTLWNKLFAGFKTSIGEN
ncbi:hypothetical protein FQN57_001375 [Myotisia sp. PD_48]|nr:hypothetical protein FQN57_001375 [Myotisia sp. PD_48]